jgi:hypothetical protein
MGNRRTRFPVAAKMALATAGASGGTPASPTPEAGSSELGTISSSRAATYTGEASSNARSSPSNRDYAAIFRGRYPVHSWNQTDSYRTPAICRTGDRKSQNQGAEGAGRDNRLQVPDDLASASQYRCRARMGSRRDQENRQDHKFVISVTDVTHALFAGHRLPPWSPKNPCNFVGSAAYCFMDTKRNHAKDRRAARGKSRRWRGRTWRA